MLHLASGRRQEAGGRRQEAAKNFLIRLINLQRATHLTKSPAISLSQTRGRQQLPLATCHLSHSHRLLPARKTSPQTFRISCGAGKMCFRVSCGTAAAHAPYQPPAACRLLPTLNCRAAAYNLCWLHLTVQKGKMPCLKVCNAVLLPASQLASLPLATCHMQHALPLVNNLFLFYFVYVATAATTAADHQVAPIFVLHLFVPRVSLCAAFEKVFPLRLTTAT